MGLSDFFKRLFYSPSPVREVHETVYSVIDVETPTSRNDRVLSIAFTRMQGDRILWTKTALVNPERRINSRNAELTGITQEDIADAPTFPQIWAEWHKEVLDGIFVAHNASFDLSVIYKCCDAYGIKVPPIQYIDTLTIARNTMKSLSKYGLGDICRELRIPLNHHRADSDCRACAALLRWFMCNGISVDDYACVYTQDDIKSSASNRSVSHYINRPSVNLNEKSKSINELLALLDEVSSDGEVTEEEVHKIQRWMADHMELKGNFPFDQIYTCVETAMQDGKLDPEELQGILETCLYLIDPVHCEACHNDIDIDGKAVCISGIFDYGSDVDVTELLTSNGAIVKPRVVSTLDYLIVGNCGCKAWTTGNYGTKVKKVIEWRFKGKDIKIVREDDLMEALHK